jgi:hypothetical protein
MKLSHPIPRVGFHPFAQHVHLIWRIDNGTKHDDFGGSHGDCMYFRAHKRIGD